ncbi:B12-binding domain-containing radical SAM protein [Vibrio coralliilyticus]|uniref:B12-binding domain-containing radical SAM protein n=1 Tax=Vibrio coralliilyticus TaxID=190893 RepID=UPI0017912591|nr:radical SAM protein [Vibrio coralliilyticus]NUW66076.1 radical SAM protein [Vibrio coralliilyticus]
METHSVALIDYKHPIDGFANRDQTGGFGSGMHASGVVGKVVSRLKKTGLRVPVLNLAYLNAIAREEGLESNFYTGMPKGESIIIIASSMLHHHHEIELAHSIKKRFPNSRLGFIGPFSGEYPERFETVSDFVIQDEPEEVFRLICRGELDPTGVIKPSSKVDLNNLPFPDWNGFDIDSYGYVPALPRKPFLTIQGSRGCPFACEFCPYLVMQGVPLRNRSNEHIVAEMRYLVDNYKIKSLLFRDITWSMNKKLSKELCKLIISQDFDLDIGVETRADTLDDELVDLMAGAGVKVVNLGIESPDDDILKASGRRPIKDDKFRSIIQKLEKSGIQVQGFYIIGLIDDTEESIQKTINYSHRLNTYTAQFCVLTPFPGTKTFRDLEHRLLTTDFSRFTEYDPVVKIDGVSPERISEYVDMAFNSYYLRPAWLLKHGLKAAKSFLGMR